MEREYKVCYKLAGFDITSPKRYKTLKGAENYAKKLVTKHNFTILARIFEVKKVVQTKLVKTI